MIRCPELPTYGVVLHSVTRGTTKIGPPYEEVRALFEDAPEAIWIIKAKDKYTRDCMDSMGLEYLELPSNKDYWGEIAAAWRDAELHYYCHRVIHIRPDKKKKVTPTRKGRKPASA
jgi:hypothetical protein